MKLVAVSDLHGNLIKISGKHDVLIIAGDWSPLYIQSSYADVMNWFNDEFIPWINSVNAKHTVFIPGNHDFVCSYPSFRSNLNSILLKNELKSTIHYLNCDSIELFGKKFYGLPFTEGLNGWAFSSMYNVDYSFDSDTDILITHQPPKIGNVGYVSLNHRDFGSRDLRDKILNSNIDINICGHIHTGNHGNTPVILNNGKLSSVYNVSILDEDYLVTYKPTIIET